MAGTYSLSDPVNLSGPSGMLVLPDGNLYVVNYVGKHSGEILPFRGCVGTFANTAPKGAQAFRHIAFVTTSVPTTPTLSTSVLALFGIAAVFCLRQFLNRQVNREG